MSTFIYALIAFMFYLLPVGAMDEVEDIQRVSEWLVRDNHVNILNQYDPDTITTLHIGSGALSSQRNFFGGIFPRRLGRDYVCGPRTSWSDELVYMNSKGDYFLEPPADIPIIYWKNGRCLFSFPQKNLTDLSKNEALKVTHREVISPMETDPDKTIYLDLDNMEKLWAGLIKKWDGVDDKIPSELIRNFFADVNHIQGDITKIQKIPGIEKFERIVIDYLGDDMFGAPKEGSYIPKFSDMDWTWVRRLSEQLLSGGTLHVEMRADYFTLFTSRRDDGPDLTEAMRLFKISKAQDMVWDKGSGRYLDFMANSVPIQEFTEKRAIEFIIKEFEQYGLKAYNSETSSPAHELYRKKHIPTRKYNTVRVDFRKISDRNTVHVLS